MTVLPDFGDSYVGTFFDLYPILSVADFVTMIVFLVLLFCTGTDICPMLLFFAGTLPLSI